MYKVTRPAEMNETFARAFNDRDLDGLLSLYEPEAALRPHGMEAVRRGARAIADELRALLALPGTMASSNTFCLEAGDLALMRSEFRIVAEDGTVVASGGGIEVVRRQADGRWLYVIDHAAGASLPTIA